MEPEAPTDSAVSPPRRDTVKQKIQIFGRIKPSKKPSAVYSVDNEEEKAGSSLEFTVPKDLTEGFVNNKKENYSFRFQKVFDQAVKQEEIFQHIAKPVADSVLAGYNGTIFAYGQTGSGKTFTITGGAERYCDRGIIPRTLAYLFESFSQDSSMIHTTNISYLEIYNELGYDLLDSRREASRLEDLPRVSIMEDAEQNIHLRNLSLQQAGNEEEALNLLFLGDTNRMIAETPMNQASTRSHCIFTIHLCRREPGSVTMRRSKLHLVDLAGSDRVSKTGLYGQQLTEAKYINLSLHYLEQVIIALSEKNRSHIPYRNSMLTSVLRDSLGGNCMTTMIATMAIDQRNVDESISTCRFAQRVALIKNEAVLNEELDPALLIAHLRREIQSLKDELAMVTGEQRREQLTLEEVHRLEECVKVFLEDPDPAGTLLLGPDMRRIQFCFSLLKKMILNQPGPADQHGDRNRSTAGTTDEDGPGDGDPGAAETAALKEMLSQRDNEISVLVKMLKKEKKKSQDAAAQLLDHTGQRSTIQDPPEPPAPSTGPPRDDARDGVSTTNGGGATQFMTRGPQLSMGKQAAFESFMRDHEDQLTIDDNKKVLRQRSAEAKRLGSELSRSRTRINDLKQQLETRRRQRAAQGVVGGPPAAEGVEGEDGVEEDLCQQITQEKQTYKNIIGRLKNLRTEIEHLQLLLDKTRVKIQRDFNQWWSRGSSEDQEPKSEATAACHHTLSPPGAPEPSTTKAPGPRIFGPKDDPPLDLGVTPYTPSTEWRALSRTTLTPSSIPLTGDQQTDADILAFIRARQNLLHRTASPQL